MTDFLTPREAADKLQVSTSTLRNWRYAGKGPPVSMVGPGTFRYPLDQLIAYIERGLLKREDHHVSV